MGLACRPPDRGDGAALSRVKRGDHFFTVVRYVERNALRANLVRRAENWSGPEPGCLLHSRRRLESIEFSSHRATRHDQIRDKSITDVQITFVLAEIADLVAFGKHAPDFRSQAERMR